MPLETPPPHPVEPQSFWQKLANLRKSKGGKLGGKLFIVWIVYQAVKGTLTTSLIWIPLLIALLHK